MKHEAIALPIEHEFNKDGSSLICRRSRRNDLNHSDTYITKLIKLLNIFTSHEMYKYQVDSKKELIYFV
jgi:hypothetical protein